MIRNPIILMITLWVNIYSAQQLTLSEAIQIALERNYQIQVSRRQMEIANKNNTWSEAGLFPTVTLTAVFNNTIQDNRENPFTFTPGIVLQQSLSPSLNVNWNVFSGFLVKMTKTRLEHLESQSRGNAMLLIENTVFDVVKTYYTAVVQREKLFLLQELLNYSRERVRLFEIRRDFGASSSLELMQFKNQYLTDSMNLVMQQISYENAIRNLSLLLNFDLDTLLRPVDPLEIKLPMIDRKLYIEQLLKNNRNIQNQYINLSLVETQTKIQQSFLYPTLSIQAGYQYSKNALRELENNLFNASLSIPNYLGTVSLRYNLYNNWKAKRAVEVAKIQEDITRINIEDLKRSVKNQGETWLRLYEMRNKLLELSQENVLYAQKAFELAKERYSLGGINSIDLMSIRNQYIQAKMAYLDSQYNRIEVFYELYRLGGYLGLEYLENK
jgi:outer membrane protein TolC